MHANKLVVNSVSLFIYIFVSFFIMMRIILDICNEKLLSIKKNERMKLNIEKLAAKFMHILKSSAFRLNVKPVHLSMHL